jgi:hypothetical protein
MLAMKNALKILAGKSEGIGVLTDFGSEESFIC